MLSAGINGLFVGPKSAQSKANSVLRLVFLYPSQIAYIVVTSAHLIKIYKISQARAKQRNSSLTEEETIYQLVETSASSSSSSSSDSGSIAIQLNNFEPDVVSRPEDEEEEEERISFDLSIFFPESTSSSSQPEIASVASSFTQQASSRFDRQIVGCVLLGNFVLGTVALVVPKLNMVFSSVVLAFSQFVFFRRQFLPARFSFLVNASYAAGWAGSFFMLLYPVRFFIKAKDSRKVWRTVYLALSRSTGALYIVLSFVSLVFILAYSKLKRNKKFELQNVALVQSPYVLKAILITNLVLCGLSTFVPWAIPFVSFNCMVFLCSIKSSFPTLLRLTKWAISAGAWAAYLALFVLKECMDAGFDFRKALKSDSKYLLLFCYALFIVFVALYTVVMLFAIHISFAEQAYVKKVMLPAIQNDVAMNNNNNNDSEDVSRDNE